jgi:hypothetical protein
LLIGKGGKRDVRWPFLALLLLVAPAPAPGGIRAIYDGQLSEAEEVRIADNGDMAIDLGWGRRLVVLRGEAYVIDEGRLTGPVVMRSDDLRAVIAQAVKEEGEAGKAEEIDNSLVGRGRMEVGRWDGEAFAPSGSAKDKPVLVVTDDPALAPLGPAMRQALEAKALLETFEHYARPKAMRGTYAATTPLFAQVGPRAPLRLWDAELVLFETMADDPAEFALPAEPLTRSALAARRARLLREEESDVRRPDITRAVFSAGRLWLVSEEGQLWSMPDGGGERVEHKVGRGVGDLCATPDGPWAVTGTNEAAKNWILHRWRDGAWQQERKIPRHGDRLVALSCSGPGPLLLTNKRLIGLGAGEATLRLQEELSLPIVQTVVHATADALFVGLNSGEWGGGLRRIDRRTGTIEIVERNATGGLCDGPLNTQCDPVHGIATIPWKPDCVALAIGLSHMMIHGRLSQVCGGRVEQLFSQSSDRLTRDPEKLKGAVEGSYGAVGFFGLAASGDALLAAGHDGLYRIEASGKVTYRRWPAFKESGEVLVSFDFPDAVLVITTINGRASVGGAAPLLAVR